MKQIQIAYRGQEEFKGAIAVLGKKYPENTKVFNIFFDKTLYGEVCKVCEVLDSEMPETEYFGCSSNVNIENGVLVENSINIICMVFEDSSAHVEAVQYDLDSADEELCGDLLKKVSERDWVKERYYGDRLAYASSR